MIVIVDANIVFSAMLNTNSKIANILMSSNNIISFIAPNFIYSELTKYYLKIAKHLKINISLMPNIQDIITRNIEFINEEIITIEHWLKSKSLCKNIDEKDIPYIAFCLFFKYKLWTGDKK